MYGNSTMNFSTQMTSSNNGPVYIPTQYNQNETGYTNRSVIPPTPGPRTIEAIQNDVRERFRRVGR